MLSSFKLGEEEEEMAKRTRGGDGSDGYTSSLSGSEDDLARDEIQPAKFRQINQKEDDEDNSNTPPPAAVVIECTLPPRCLRHPTSFTSHAEYERHYREDHSKVCFECSRTFPSDRLLDLHISEQHDPFIEARRERGEDTYQCFVEECPLKFKSKNKRIKHLVGEHQYPEEYMFSIVTYGLSKGRTSLLRRPKQKGNPRKTGDSMEIEPKDPADTKKSGRGPRRGRRNRNTTTNHDDDDTLPDASLQDVAAQKQNKKNPDEISFEPDDADYGEPELDPEFETLQESMSALRLVPSKIRFGKGPRR
ncbi:hypothetical protein BZA70DRAFT_282095 [Myxozyma melibiosi]|uniref:C2H2-type domain-containing protein n=1 Tax=Myxozyma melibiosi TaxID=54550 RepID=A0ABR1F3T1_9ASCO